LPRRHHEGGVEGVARIRAKEARARGSRRPSDTIAELSLLADEVVALETPEPFFAVGAHYRDFAQTTDEEVMDLLSRGADQKSPS